MATTYDFSGLQRGLSSGLRFMQEQDALDEGARQSDLDRQQRRMEFNATDKQNTAALEENARQWDGEYRAKMAQIGVNGLAVEGDNGLKVSQANVSKSFPYTSSFISIKATSSASLHSRQCSHHAQFLKSPNVILCQDRNYSTPSL